jgi:hypothetical protein
METKMLGRKPPAATALFLACTASLAAQSLKVYSEFQRIGPDGAVIAADREERSREILSPAVARNAYASYHVVLSAPAGAEFTLHFAQNPDNAFQATFYREIHDAAGIPDRLEKIQLPLESKIDGSGRPLVLWMDLWVDATAPVRRVRVEPQVWIGDRWIIYPLEVRVYPNIVPDAGKDGAELPPVSGPADTFALGPLRTMLCGQSVRAAPPGLTIRQMIQRNARQDAALAGAYKNALGSETVLKRLAAEAGIPDAAVWCSDSKAATRPPGASGPEWYLKVRDRLVRGW